MTGGMQSVLNPIHSEESQPEVLMRKIQDRAIESDLKMVEQTIALLCDGGIKAVTLESVGMHSGYSRGLVTRRYGSKEGLLIRVLDFLNQWVAQIIPMQKGIHGQVAIECSIRQVAEMIQAHPQRIRAYYWLWLYAMESSPEAHEKLVSMQNYMFEQQLLWFKQAVALEEITRNADIEMMAEFIRTMMRGLVYSWMLDERFDIVKKTNEFADIHVRLMFKNSHCYDQTRFWGE